VKVRDGMSTKLGVDTLLRNVSVEVVGDTEVLAVGYESPSPTIAATVANGFAGAYVGYRMQQARDQFTTAEAPVQSRIDDLKTQLVDLNDRISGASDQGQKDELGAQRDALVAQIGVMQGRIADLESTTVQAPAEVIQRAEVPKGPASPNKGRDAALAAMLGLFLGVGFAFARERFDDRIKSREDLEEKIGAPVLAVVPRVNGWRERDRTRLVMRTEPRSAASEAYRTLGTNIQFIASRDDVHVIVVTSALGGEGKSTTSANLAVVLARSGRKVILVSADLRKPRIERFFGLPHDVGLSSLLSDAAMVPTIELPSKMLDPGHSNMRLLPSGLPPANPAELLSSDRCAELIKLLRPLADFVIIDTPPVLAVADASIVAAYADGVLIVADGATTKHAALAQARAHLDAAGVVVIGAVYNNFDPNQSHGYTYYSFDRYNEGSSSPPPAAVRDRSRGAASLGFHMPGTRRPSEPAEGSTGVPALR
jgi:capsular exopolysaccharide synthesis family protein